MLLGIDVGNTNITLGRLAGAEVVDSWRLPTHATLDFGAAVEEFFGLDAVGEAVMVSVVPSVGSRLAGVLAERDVPVLHAVAATIPMDLRVDRPAQVGADRLVNAYAAGQLYGVPAIVVDLGTATTFDVVDSSGAFVGGAIAPGLELGLEALAARTALLPRVAAAMPPRAIGADTISAIQSGAVIGYIGLIRELTSRMQKELDQPAKVILTGGLSQATWAAEVHADAIDPDLTLRGLGLLAMARQRASA